MNSVFAFFRRFGRANRSLRQEVADELEAHLSMKARDLEEAGVAAGEARRRAIADFGDLAKLEAACVRIRSGSPFGSVARGARMASAVMVGTVGLVGLGLLADASILRPSLGQADEEIYDLHTKYEWGGAVGISVEDFFDWRREGPFAQMALFRQDNVGFSHADTAETLRATYYSAGFFELLEERPLFGQVGDHHTAVATQSVILSHALWARRFGADEAILGQKVHVEGQDRRVIAVLSALPRRWDSDVFIPIAVTPRPSYRAQRAYRALATLADGTSLTDARRHMVELSALLAERFPASNRGWAAIVGSPRRRAEKELARVWLLAGVCALGLILACICFGHSPRSRFTSNLALDAAARGQSVPRFALVHRVLPTLLAGVVGFTIAHAGIESILEAVLSDSARLYPVRADGATLILALVAVILLSLVLTLERPLRTPRARVRPVWVLRSAIAFVLLTVGGGLLWNLVELDRIPLDYDPERLAVARVALPATLYSTNESRTRFFDQVLAAARLRGILAVSLSEAVPPTSDVLYYNVRVDGGPLVLGERRPGADRVRVGADYFEFMGFKISAGRGILVSDLPKSEPVAVVNETMARRLWPDSDPVGRRFELSGNGTLLRVVGVLEDVRERGLRGAPRPTAYLPFAQDPAAHMYVLAKSGDVADAARVLTASVAAVDPRVPGDRARSMKQVLASRRFGLRTLAILLTATGVVTLVMSGFGAARQVGGLRQLTASAALGIGLGYAAVNELQPVVGASAAGIQTAGPMVPIMSAQLVFVAVIVGCLIADRAPRWRDLMYAE